MEPISLIVIIKVVPGEFDELLSWPCKEKVRVTCENQGVLLHGNSESKVIDFEKDCEPWCRSLNDTHDTYRGVQFGLAVSTFYLEGDRFAKRQQRIERFKKLSGNLTLTFTVSVFHFLSKN